MKVNVRDLDVDMTLGNNGVLFTVRNNTTYKGKLRVGKGKIEWCKGRKPIGSGVKVNWDTLIAFFEDKNS